MTMDHTQKTLLVTGGSSGIGLGVAQAMSRLGVRVAILARNKERGLSVLRELKTVDLGQHIFVQTDASNDADFKRAIHEVEEEFGRLDLVFHGVGMDCPGFVEDLDVSVFDKVFQTNLKSAYVLLHSVLPKMLMHQQGVIVFNSSNKGLVAHVDDPLYCASKAALNMMMKSTALRVASQGVRINAVCPGPVRTASLLNETRSASRVPMKRVAEVAEIVGVVRFLFSDEASYITGTEIPVDGGKSAGHLHELLNL